MSNETTTPAVAPAVPGAAPAPAQAAPAAPAPGSKEAAAAIDAQIQAGYAAAAQQANGGVDHSVPDYMRGMPTPEAAPAPEATPATPAVEAPEGPAAEEAPAVPTPESANTEEAPAAPGSDVVAFTEAAAPFTKEFAETGALSDASVTAAATALGIPEAVVRDYVAAKAGTTPATPATPAAEAPASSQSTGPTSAETAVAIAKSYQAIGGKDNWAAFSQYLATNVSEGELATYAGADAVTRASLIEVYAPGFRAVAAANGQQVQNGVQPAVPVAPRDITASAPAATPASFAAPVAQPFSSPQEQSLAFADPRYGRDAAYTAQQQERLAAGFIAANKAR